MKRQSRLPYNNANANIIKDLKMTAVLRGRPAHAPGPTFFSYTPNGRQLLTAGLNPALRVFEHGSDDEPAIIDVATESHTAVACANTFAVVASEAGEVTKYSLANNNHSMEDILVRCSAPVRSLALSPDGEWLAVASDELEVKVVNTSDMEKIMYLREQSRPAKHVAFDSSGATLAVSSTDGMIYMYSLSSEQPQLLKRIDGIIGMLDSASDSSANVIWHPDGRAFAVPNQSREIQVVARKDWQKHKVYSGGHKNDITALAWSPNGALLASASIDKTIVLWDARSQQILKTFNDLKDVVLNLQWHPKDNVVSYTNTNGELFIRENFVPDEYRGLLRAPLQPSPLNNEPLAEVSGNARKHSKTDDQAMYGYKRTVEDDYLDDLLGPDAASENGDLDGFIDDDDGAGYAEEPNLYGKRHATSYVAPRQKRQALHDSWKPRVHPPIQSGSTPFKGNRRYLCLNLVGFIWTVQQDLHHTVTVEFYDRQEHRDFHFTDPYLYDKACLNSKGSLFSCPSSAQHPAMIYYRPHETWTARVDWRIRLPPGEEVTSLSLSESCIVATTSAGYTRVYSLFGLPLKIYRQKSTPAVTCASWRDYVMTVGNGPVGGDGSTKLLYTIENVKRDETYQSEDTLALPEGTSLHSLMFSDRGDPCIYDSNGVLLILQHWRRPGQAKWVPLLDTRALKRLEGGRKEENYWPVAVANDRFYCIILKGGEQYPYFPRPLHSDFEFDVPLSSAVDDEEDKEAAQLRSLEEQFVRRSVQHSLLVDLVENSNATSAQRSEVSLAEREVDKILLQLLAAECREGEERGMKALELTTLMKDRTGQMLEAAGKVAARFNRDILGEKIRELAERRLVGLVDEDDM